VSSQGLVHISLFIKLRLFVRYHLTCQRDPDRDGNWRPRIMEPGISVAGVILDVVVVRHRMRVPQDHQIPSLILWPRPPRQTLKFCTGMYTTILCLN
jgi:hypothetical protein